MQPFLAMGPQAGFTFSYALAVHLERAGQHAAAFAIIQSVYEPIAVLANGRRGVTSGGASSGSSGVRASGAASSAGFGGGGGHDGQGDGGGSAGGSGSSGGPPDSSERDSSSSSSSSNSGASSPYLMVSYAWGPAAADGTHPMQEKARLVADRLQAAGYNVWMDAANHNLAAAGGAVDISHACARKVVHAAGIGVCLSEFYGQRPTCMLELNAAMDFDIPIYFVNVGSRVDHPPRAHRNDAVCTVGWTPRCIDFDTTTAGCVRVYELARGCLWALCRTIAEADSDAGIPTLLGMLRDGRLRNIATASASVPPHVDSAAHPAPAATVAAAATAVAAAPFFDDPPAGTASTALCDIVTHAFYAVWAAVAVLP
jgi:hypothetical protein